MQARLRISLGALALGVGLLLTAQLAGASRGFRQGGVFVFGTAGASVQIDPQLAYVSTAWWLEYATAAKLFNYPDRRGLAGGVLGPEVASRYLVSKDGRTWTFVIRTGLRFSDGSPVTAASFAYAIDRVANHDLASPGAPFITDDHGTNIVGAKAVNDGMALHVRGVVVKGNRLVVHLTRPDSTLLTKLSMPFFQATSTRLPLDREVTTAYPSAGPYFFARHEADQRTELRRNRYYRGARPHHLGGLDLLWNLRDALWSDDPRDEWVGGDSLLDSDIPSLVAKYGVNKSRFWVEPQNCVGYLAFNNRRPLLRDNVALRRAINWLLDRRAALADAPPYSASPWTHLLPPAFPGSITAKRLQPYGDAPNRRKALRLAAGHLRTGVVNIGYRSTAAGGSARAEALRGVLIRLGINAERIKLKGFSGADLYDAMGKRNSDLDFGISMGLCADLEDPLDLIGNFFGVAEYLHGTKFERRLAAARKLQGKDRLRAAGRLDIDVMNELAPVAVMQTYNNRYAFSSRVDPKSLVYQGVYSDWSIPALALK
jgi:ABC-type oligopeptide transport system substrate-binding subunit